jgi:hypothetical protein
VCRCRTATEAGNLLLIEPLPESDAHAPPLPALQPSSAQSCDNTSGAAHALSQRGARDAGGQGRAACLQADAAARAEEGAAIDRAGG